jgi:FkbM family methyltransferase
MPSLLDDRQLIASSSLFDGAWYLREYPDVAATSVDPVLHYLQCGAQEGRNPSPQFDTRWYLRRHDDVARAGMNPLVHYVMYGAAEGREIRTVQNSLWPQELQLGGRLYRMNELLANAIATQVPWETWEHWESWMDPVYQAALRCRPGAFLDVGVNLGQTLLKVLAYDRCRQYLGFEPHPACSFLVQQFIDDNNLEHCKIIPVGLYNCDRIITLYGRDNDYSATATVVDGFRPAAFYSSQRFVSVRQGDHVLAEIDVHSADIIKVDVEGGELEVFQGLSKTLRSSMPLLIFEVLNHFIAATGAPLDENTLQFRELRIRKLEELIRGMGYGILNICPDNQLRNVHKIVPEVSADLSRTNYIAVAPKDLERFLKSFPGQYIA